MDFAATFRNNRVRIFTLLILAMLFFAAVQGMETKDWVITVMRGLAAGAVVFLVASGLSLIFGLMDVLNLAHGEIFMLGAFIGWTVYVRPDTFFDVLTPILLVAVGFALTPVWNAVLGRWEFKGWLAKLVPWLAILLGLAMIVFSFANYPITKWHPDDFGNSPITNALELGQGIFVLPEPLPFEPFHPVVVLMGLLLGGALMAMGIAALSRHGKPTTTSKPDRLPYVIAGSLLIMALLIFVANDALSSWLFEMNSTWRFFIAMAVTTLFGGLLGGLIESTMIRPLYDRPIYQIMLTLGIGFIIVEITRAIWGRPSFTMPKPALWANTGEGCPATSLGEALTNQCSTMLLFDGRIRTYNEIFIILIGILVLIGIWLLIQRTRLGMIIRAGVQDSEMVEALGINVRRVFTLVFAVGVALATLGGVLAAPSTGLSLEMGVSVLLLALVALAIGGLSSFPGAAVGAVLVGLMQQFIIKYGGIGINLPFLEEPFKPSPPLVPASVVLLMVIILLILPNGLFGRSD
ncbi:MAG: ABC transporter permease subunit [Candidatus Promineifilaceae bacterium]|jgi:branched-chain amino acid transport system permease protein